MNPFDFFDRVYVIHVPNKERKEHIQSQLDTIGTNAQFIHAHPPKCAMSNMRRNPPAEFGVNLSHIKAVVKAIEDKAEHPLFLEDDVVFEDFPRIEEIPPHYSVLYLGGHPREKVERYSDHLVRVGKFSFAEAYSINKHSLLPFFNYWTDRVGKKDAMYDFILGEYASLSMGFACYPVVTRQVSGHSLVSGCKDEKGHLLVKGWATNLV